jgi:hypothetical protein
MRERRIGLAIIAGLALLAAAHRPTASINIDTRAASDPAPHRLNAAVDLGLVAVSVLWTWSDRHLIDRR